METFTDSKAFIENPDFQHQRKKSIKHLNFDAIDEPIQDIIKQISEMTYCFTQQSCYGHFVYEGQRDQHNIYPLPSSPISGQIEYRIAYLAFCLENNEKGKDFLKKLERLTLIDEHNIQFGCAEWFWKRQVNSFVLQVEPERFKYQDKASVDYEEALHLEKIKNTFFMELRKIIFV
jgi:hypothetical protein